MNESALPRVLLSRASDLQRSCPVYVRGASEWRDGRRTCRTTPCVVVCHGRAIFEGASALSEPVHVPCA